MSYIYPAPALTCALRADALVTGSMAVIHLAFATTLAEFTGLAPAMLVGTGVFMAAYAASLLVTLRQARLWRAWIGFIIIGNIGWAAAAGAMALGWAANAPLSAWGVAFLAFHAAGVSALAIWEWLGLTRSEADRLIAA